VTWPTDTDSSDELLIAKNNWWTTLPAGISNGDTTFSISNGDQLQDTKGVISIEDEVIYYDTITRTSYSAVLGGCLRGYDGTIARPHVAGTRVELRWVAQHHNGLAQRIRVLETFLGPLLHQDPLNSVPFDNLAERLAAALPLVVAASGDPWVLTHPRRRIVGVQLWVEVSPGVFDQIDAPITQVVNPGGNSTVTATFGTAVNGYAVLL
jgi:hypothetical protein